MDKPHQPRKRFGQNFLCDQNIINKIINNFAPKAADNILEIGPGQGAMTSYILDKAEHLYLVEIDKDLAEILTQKYQDKITLFNTDILKFDLNQIITSLDTKNNNKLRIIGNLPYNISTPILFHLFEYIDHIQDMMFMLQLEVVDRITAKPNTKQYGRLSVMTQYFCRPEKLFSISPTAFNPPPKVHSAIIHLTPKKNITKNIDINVLNNIVTAAFNQRRKTISNSMKKYITSEKLIEINIDPKARAENLTVEQYITITDTVME